MQCGPAAAWEKEGKMREKKESGRRIGGARTRGETRARIQGGRGGSMEEAWHDQGHKHVRRGMHTNRKIKLTIRVRGTFTDFTSMPGLDPGVSPANVTQ